MSELHCHVDDDDDDDDDTMMCQLQSHEQCLSCVCVHETQKKTNISHGEDFLNSECDANMCRKS